MSNVVDILSKGETAEKIQRWVELSSGEFSIRDVDYDLFFDTPELKRERTLALENLVREGVLDRHHERRGLYRPKDMGLEPMDFTEASEKPLDIWMPFRLYEYVEIMAGNVIIIAGEPNAGKTALLLNIIEANMHKFDVHYFNSEMDAGELKKRLMLFGSTTLNEWHFSAYQRDRAFSDVIVRGEGAINIIDYLEVHDEFYKVGQYIKDIHSNLDGALAVIAIQKNRGTEDGIGGQRTMEKARLALTLSAGNECKITKAKNWKKKNPNGWVCHYKLANGCVLIPQKDPSGQIWKGRVS